MASNNSALSLQGLPNKLHALTSCLKIDGQIRQELDDLTNQVVECADKFSKKVKKNTEQLYIQGELVQQAHKPGDIKTEVLQKTLTDARDSFTASKMNILELQTKVHSQIESCRYQIKAHTNEKNLKGEQIETKKIKISTLEENIKSNETDAENLTKNAREMDDRADDLRKVAEMKKEAAIIGGTVIGTAGVLLAPFTFGTSLLVGGAAAGITVGVNLSEAADFNKSADSCRSDASRKRSKANELRGEVCAMNATISDLEEEVCVLTERIESLEEAMQALHGVTSFLGTSVKVSDDVVEAIQDMDEVLKSTTLTGWGFSLSFKSRRERLAEQHLQNLKEAWKNIHTSMDKSRMFAIKN